MAEEPVKTRKFEELHIIWMHHAPLSRREQTAQHACSEPHTVSARPCSIPSHFIMNARRPLIAVHLRIITPYQNIHVSVTSNRTGTTENLLLVRDKRKRSTGEPSFIGLFHSLCSSRARQLEA